MPEVLPVAKSLANLVGVSGHVVLDHGLNDGTRIAQRPAPLIVATAAFYCNSQVSGNGHQHGLEDGHFLDLFASVGIGRRIDLSAHGLDSFLPVNFSLAQVEHIGRRSRQNVLAKGVVSHCVNPLSVCPGGFPPRASIEYYTPAELSREISNFFEIFFRHIGGAGRDGMKWK